MSHGSRSDSNGYRTPENKCFNNNNFEDTIDGNEVLPSLGQRNNRIGSNHQKMVSSSCQIPKYKTNDSRTSPLLTGKSTDNDLSRPPSSSMGGPFPDDSNICDTNTNMDYAKVSIFRFYFNNKSLIK